MKYTEFLHTIETEITARLDNDFKLTIHPVKKNNGMIYDGLVIINPKFNIAPTIYLNPYYHWYLDGDGWSGPDTAGRRYSSHAW